MFCLFHKRSLVLGDTAKNIKEVSSDRRAEAKLGPNPDAKSVRVCALFFQLVLLFPNETSVWETPVKRSKEES